MIPGYYMRWHSLKRGWIWSLAALLALLALGMLAAALTRRSPEPMRSAAIGEWETDPAVWGRGFPRQYRSWLESQESSRADIGYGPGRTRWGGDRSADPGTAHLFAGYAQSKDHQDLPSRHPAVCQDCHDPRTLGLRVSRRPFLEAMGRRGVDLGKATRQELRSYVCAQCHGTHSVYGENAGPRLPWDRGFNIDDIIATYSADGGGFSDWTHALSKASMIRLRHPEFELWSQGIHAARGVTCADCHMPQVVEGSMRFSGHQLKSPLLGGGTSSCRTCHHWSVREFQTQVELIQERTAALQKRAVTALADAHAALGACVQAGLAQQQLVALQSRLRDAQMRWDFVASDHSCGFHAPQEAARALAIAIDQARQVERDAQILRLKAKIPEELPKDSLSPSLRH